MTLADLYPPGSHLSDVPVDFRGMTFRRWLLLDIERQAEAYRKIALPQTDAARTDWKGRAVVTSRDRYGWKSI